MHPDGRRWFGRVFGRSFQLLIDVPGDEPIVRSYRVLDRARAECQLAEAIIDLRESGFIESGPCEWPVPEPRAGAVIVAKAQEFSPKWILEAIAREVATQRSPLPHGENYRHRFVDVPIRGSVIACYYEIVGYQTREECAAFEDAFFIMDRFAKRLNSPFAPTRFIAICDVGFCDTGYDVLAFDQSGQAIGDVEAALPVWLHAKGFARSPTAAQADGPDHLGDIGDEI